MLPICMLQEHNFSVAAENTFSPVRADKYFLQEGLGQDTEVSQCFQTVEIQIYRSIYLFLTYIVVMTSSKEVRMSGAKDLHMTQNGLNLTFMI